MKKDGLEAYYADVDMTKFKIPKKRDWGRIMFWISLLVLSIYLIANL